MTLDQAKAEVERSTGDLLVDFSSVSRVDAGAIRSLDELATLADARSVAAGGPVNVVLCAVRVDVYKVLKLLNLAQRFSFLS